MVEAIKANKARESVCVKAKPAFEIVACARKLTADILLPLVYRSRALVDWEGTEDEHK